MKSYVYTTSRCFALVLCFATLIAQKSFSQQFLTTIDGWNAYVHLPADYDRTSMQYPLICFIPGTGECGTSAAKLLAYGPSKFIAEGNTMTFTVNGKTETPIVISLQPVALWPSASTLNRKLDSIMARYRVDRQRVHVTGLSMGGWSWDNFVDNYSPAYTSRITSIVSLSAPEPDNTVSNMRFYALGGGTAWFFEGNQDLRGNDKIRDTMNAHVPGSARYTLYAGGHCCWNTFYNPSWMENGESIYTWMLKQRKTLISGPLPPEADAGDDFGSPIILSTFGLRGYGNDPNGLPVTFSWSKVAGPAGGAVATPNVLQTSVTGLNFGTYRYELKVTNTLGLVARDTITIDNGNVVLPVVLVDFTAKQAPNKTVELHWQTNAEIGNAGFILEKSIDGQLFSELCQLEGKGGSAFGANYNFIDLLPQPGLNMYRLKMLDGDRTFSYSKIVTVQAKLNNSIEVIAAYATDSRFQLKTISYQDEIYNLTIVDAAGKKLHNNVIKITTGVHTFYQPLSLPRGVYYLNLRSQTKNISSAFIRE